MKKTLSLVLVCILALTAVVAVQAEPFYLEDMGLTVVVPENMTVSVPEGMNIEDMSAENTYFLAITVDGDENLRYAFALSYLEEFEDKDLADLTEEEGNMLVQGISMAMVEPEFGAVETDMLDMMVIASGDGSQLHYLTLMGGWLLDVVANRADGPLAEEEIHAAAEILFNLEFDE